MTTATPSRPTLPTAPVRAGRASMWALGAIVALGAAIRFSTLGEQSFWFDEAVTHGIVAHGLGHVISQVPKTESTPPLYYVLAWLWTRVFGVGEVGLRSFSALCGTLTIPVVWAIGRRLVSERVGLIAALLTAVNPLLFWYSQESRSYALVTLLCAFSLLMLTRALERPTSGRLLWFSVVSAFALCAHYFAAFAIVPEVVWLLVALRRRGVLHVRAGLCALAPLAVMAAVLAPLAIHQDDGRAGFISTQSGSLAYRFAQLIKQDMLGDGQPHKAVLGAIGSALVLLAVGLLLWRGDRRERAGAALPFVVAGGGVLLAVIAAVLGSDYFNTRNMLPTWPALALLVACGFGAVRAGRLGAAGLAGLCGLSLYCVFNVIHDPAFERDDWRGAARALGPAAAPRAVIVDGNVGPVSVAPYLSRIRDYPAAGRAVKEVDVIWLRRKSFGQPILPVAPPPLPGYTLRVLRTRSYVVIRYLAPAPVLEPPGELRVLYPERYTGRTLLQGG